MSTGDKAMETGDSPTTSGNPVKQFSVMLENRIGALHSMINLLGSCGVYALGFSVQDSFDVTILRLVVSDPEQLETFFMERGISHTVNDIVVIELKSGEDSLEKTLRALSAAETNIYVSYPLLAHPRDHSVLAISVDDPHFACNALQSQGFKLLYQNDLSR